MRFEIVARCEANLARVGRLYLDHGVVETPAFMPVGTQATVKTVGSEDLEGLGYRLILANAYHLALRPGDERIERLGGIHRFMGWRHCILTDSGGYQVLSLSRMRKITGDGVHFRSPVDGAEVFLTPERSIEIQRRLGVDIAMSLDVCPAFSAEKTEIEDAIKLTTDWARRCVKVRGNLPLFGIVQGGIYQDLRERSAAELCRLGFDGYAIGGVSVGEPVEMQYPVVAFTSPLLPDDRPRYLMGVGRPKDIIHAVRCGIDMFDCVLPTRNGRHHALYTMKGVVNILNSQWADYDGPVDEESVFPQTERYTAAYLHHLFKTGEPLAPRLATLHNLAFYARLMGDIRAAVRSASWSELEAKYANA